MKNKITTYFFLLLLPATVSFANCVGTANFYTCNDLSGNSYSVNKFGNQTYMNGFNSNTGSQWSQNSSTFGNTTIINGSANGRQWNETIQTAPGITTYSGRDSHGNNFYRVCTTAGCF